MSKYQIKFKASASKEYKKLPSQVKKRINLVIEKLSDNPRSSGVIKLQGNNDLYRIRVGDYRIVFEIYDRELIIKVIRIGHRRDIYQR